MTWSEEMHYRVPPTSRCSFASQGEHARVGAKSTRSSGPRPLGAPASDLSMFYDRHMAAAMTKGAGSRRRRAGKKSTRMGLAQSADMERRRHQDRRHFSPHNGVNGRHLADNSLLALVSPQLQRRQPGGFGRDRHDGRPPRDLGLLRSHTIAEFRSGSQRVVNLTGVNAGERQPQQNGRPGLHRSSTWCATSNATSRFLSSSTSSLPLLPNAEGRREALISASCDGLVDRVSALRSLANNPRFKVTIVNGSPRISPRQSSHHPSGQDATSHGKKANEEVVIECSRHGYHSRSNSPTYRRLIQTKECLDVALCKELRGIRRRLEGQKARENSAIDGGLRLGIEFDDDANVRALDEWYATMVSKEMENEDRDVDIIDNMTTCNSCTVITGVETLDTSSPPPPVELKFDSKYVQSHINDWDILNIDVEEVERKARERREKEKRRKPMRARSQSPTYFRRSCEVCCLEHPTRVEKPRAEFLRTNKSRRVKFRARKKDDYSDDSNSVDDIIPPRLQEPTLKASEILPSALPPPPPPPSTQSNPTNKKSARTRSSLSSVSSMLNTKSIADDSTLDYKESVVDDALSETVESEIVLPSITPAPPPELLASTPEIRLPSAVKISEPEIKAKSPSPPPPDPPKLTDKEKFLLMRKRMEERQKERTKKKESFEDYSMIAFAGARIKRAGQGEAAGLGNTLSNRLENMASFKSNKPRDGRRGLLALMSDDDDDDDEDDDDDDDDEE